jgi:uncharacterized protein (TIGR00730 family)
VKIAVYLGSHTGKDPLFVQSAKDLGTWIGSHGHTLVYGGAAVGMMGVLADACQASGGRIIGVMPAFMKDGKKNHTGLDQFIETPDMSSRKQKMLDLSDACIAMPGGPGTLEEVSQVISAIRLGLKKEPCLLLNLNGFYEPLKKQFSTMKDNGFVEESEMKDVHFFNTVQECASFLEKEGKDNA